MPEIGSSGLMSGDGKRGVGHRPQATAPILDSTKADMASAVVQVTQSQRPLRRCWAGRYRAPLVAPNATQHVPNLVQPAARDLTAQVASPIARLDAKTTLRSGDGKAQFPRYRPALPND